MAKETKYSINNLKKDFPNDEACAEYIFDALHTRECSCGGTYSLLKGRRQLQCSKCRFQIAPTAGTIFHKSPTPLTLWFHAVFIFSNAKSGISAKEMERQLGVTYKCAYRILSQIRTALGQSDKKLRGMVEADAGYFGGRKYAGKNNENLGDSIKHKSAVMAVIERGGEMRAQTVPNLTARELEDFIKEFVEAHSHLMTDSAKGYKRLDKKYNREQVDHHRREFARGNVHVNSVETWFSHVKRSMKGTFKSVSKRHLQSYLDAFVFHYNNRRNDKERFSSLLGTLIASGAR